jgi:DNA (cytosine-5)-methyltransferase 1
MFQREQVVVNFAGGGGACEGIRLALGYGPHHAVNHNEVALGMHRINHPQTRHWCEDVYEVDPFELMKEGPLGLVWSSPDCRHFSKAKGGQPVSAKIRGLVLVMLKYAKAGARVLMMENVEEISTWGPLVQMVKGGELGWYPDPQHVGRTWKAFLACLGSGIDPDHPDLPEFLELLDGAVTKEECVRGFGYHYEAREIRGFQFRAPTIRNRLFMIARNDGREIVWPEATHGDPKKLKAGQEKWRIIGDLLDYSLACPSIFLSRAEARRIKCKRPLAKNTLQRVATGVGRFVIHADEPFIVNLTHAGSQRVESIDEPLRTVTGANRGEKALVQTAQVPFVTEHANGSSQRNMSANEPLRTACANVKGGHFAMVSGSLVQTGYGERKGQAPRAMDLQEPLGTVVAGGGKHALAAASLIKMRGKNIGSAADEPIGTVSAGGQHHGLVAASLVRHFGESVGGELDAPCPTVMPAGGGKTGLVAVHMAQHNGGFNTVEGRPVDAPLSAITGSGSQQQLVAVSAAAFYGSEADGQGMNEPARTVTAKARLAEVESRAVYPLTPAQIAGALRVARFLRKFGVEFEGPFAMVRGHVIVDIGMRMLTPRELFRAQGFEDDYVIDTAWIIDRETGELIKRRLTKSEQIRLCGNSVCPTVAEALVRANVPELIDARPRPKWRPTFEEYSMIGLAA